MKRLELTGQRFGRLVALNDAGRLRKGKSVARAWHWRCDCGTEFIDWSKEMVKGRKVSCGCRQRETAIANISPMTPEKANKRCRDLTGQRYGRLLVISRSNSSSHGRLWNCVCDCGAQVSDATTSNLISGGKKSCGCLQSDNGKANISKASEARRLILAANRSPLISGLFFKPYIRKRAASVVHRCEE